MAAAVAAVLLVVTFARASLLHYPNRAWTALGLLLSRIVNPVVMAILFYVVVTPTGMLLRAMGKICSGYDTSPTKTVIGFPGRRQVRLRAR